MYERILGRSYKAVNGLVCNSVEMTEDAIKIHVSHLSHNHDQNVQHVLTCAILSVIRELKVTKAVDEYL